MTGRAAKTAAARVDTTRRADPARARPWLACGVRTLLAAIFSSSIAAPLRAEAVCERTIAKAAKKYDIPLAVFYGVGLTETGSRGRLHPFAINVDGRAFVHASLEDGVRGVVQARRRGGRMIDIGCMQINHHYHAANFNSLEDMFDPEKNVDYAASLLRTLRGQQGSWTMAVARYNAGPNNNPAQKRYVCGVIGNMVASGFGSWTDNAEAFCK